MKSSIDLLTMLSSVSFYVLLMAGAMQLSQSIAQARKPQHRFRRRRQYRSKTIQSGLGDLITDLPGLTFTPSFRQYSGYLTVSEEHDRNIFYWYIESENDPVSDPLILWTNGGPGCSGLIGLLQEHGPYILDEDLQLLPNPFSWNKVANMLYIEQPAGVGFSYSKTKKDYTTGDARVAEDNYQLILQFLKLYPERRSNNFYIASESYGGHYMPQLALKILNKSNKTNPDDTIINFKGMLVGNPAVDFFYRVQFQVQTLYYHGLVPQNIYAEWDASCNTRTKLNTLHCGKLLYSATFVSGDGINPYALDYPVCNQLLEQEPQGSYTTPTHRNLIWSSMSPQARHLIHPYHSRNNAAVSSLINNITVAYQPCASVRANEYLNRNDVRTALHVHKRWAAKNWTECSDSVTYSDWDFLRPVVHLYMELVDMAKAHHHDLDILVFSGDDDSICGTAGTQFWIGDLNISGKEGQTWVPWTGDDKQIAGYVTQFDLGENAEAKFTFATVHGAGHEVPAYKPKEALIMLMNYFRGVW